MTTHSPATLISDLKREVQGTVTDEAAILTEHSKDFGRLISKTPRVVVFPSSSQDVAAVIRYANKQGVPVSTQGMRHTQSGQALSDGGIVISLAGGMDRILDLDKAGRVANVQAGCVWRNLVQAVYSEGLIPLVLTNNLGVTIGGTLSMAGIGVASHRYGVQGDTADELEVVTGQGDIVTCSREQDSDLFWSVLATLGQFGVITRAKIRLRPYLPATRTYYLLYDNMSVLLEDVEKIFQEDTFDYVESWCTPCVQGLRRVGDMKQAFAAWFNPLHLTVEFDPKKEPVQEEKLRNLRFYRHMHTEDNTLLEFANRMEPIFEIWKRLGTWPHAHPWMETILPWGVTSDYITNVLENFPPGALIGGHILLWPSRGNVSKVPYLMYPEGDFVMGFGILPALGPDFVDLALPKLNMASDFSMMVGGKRYLSGWVQFTPEQWAQHYGDKWPAMQELKRQYDPKGLLNPGFFSW